MNGGSGTTLALKRANLIPHNDPAVGPFIPEDVNRKSYHIGSGGYHVEGATSSPGVLWPVGSWVVIQDLGSKPELNGREGKVLKCRDPPADQEARYQVLVAGSEAN